MIILDYFRTVFVKIAKTKLTSRAVAVLNQVKIIEKFSSTTAVARHINRSF